MGLEGFRKAASMCLFCLNVSLVRSHVDFFQGSRKPKDSIPASHVSADPPLGEVDMTSRHKLLKPDDELDELDAAEAAQFKAEVQGHRHHGYHEVSEYRNASYQNRCLISMLNPRFEQNAALCSCAP